MYFPVHVHVSLPCIVAVLPRHRFSYQCETRMLLRSVVPVCCLFGPSDCSGQFEDLFVSPVKQ